MKTSFKMNVELTDKDVLEEETLKAMRAFAKNIARNEIEKTLKSETERIVHLYIREVNEKHSWVSSDTKIERIIKETIKESIKQEIKETCDVKKYFNKSLPDLVNEERDKAMDYVKTYLEACLMEEPMQTMIKNEIKKLVPELLLDSIKKCMTTGE